MSKQFEHETVLLNEAVAALNIKSDGVYIDATFGRGGHSAEILKQLDPNGRLLLIDKDPLAIAHATESFKVMSGYLYGKGLLKISRKHCKRQVLRKQMGCC